MSGGMKQLVRLYPRAWRERYEEEFVAMLEQRPASGRDYLDVALGALDAWLAPQVVSEGRTGLISEIRSSVLVVLWAWVGLVVAGVGFQKMTEYDDFVEAARESAAVGAAFDVVVVGAVVALAATLVGGAPIAISAIRQALVEGRKDVPLLFCVPPLSLVAFTAYALLLVRVVYPALGEATTHDSVNVALFLSLAGMFLLAAVSSAASARPPWCAPRSGSVSCGLRCSPPWSLLWR